MSVAAIISRILEVLADAKGTPNIDITMRGTKLSLVADMGAAGKRAAAMAGDVGVTEDAVLRVLERRKAGMNLASLARSLDVRRKTAVKPVLATLIALGKVERASGGKFRIPGRIRRGRRPGSANKAADVPAAKPVAALGPKRPTPQKKGAAIAAKAAAKPAKPVAKTATAKKKPSRSRSKRPVVAKKASPATEASTPVTTDEPPASAEPPRGDPTALVPERHEDAA